MTDKAVVVQCMKKICQSTVYLCISLVSSPYTVVCKLVVLKSVCEQMALLLGVSNIVNFLDGVDFSLGFIHQT